MAAVPQAAPGGLERQKQHRMVEVSPGACRYQRQSAVEESLRRYSGAVNSWIVTSGIQVVSMLVCLAIAA
jgi:hypothetical protein